MSVETRAGLLPGLERWAPFWFGAAIVGAGALMRVLVLGSSDDVGTRLCDQAVAALLHSKDPVEVQRAGIIIHEVGCGISRRAGDWVK